MGQVRRCRLRLPAVRLCFNCRHLAALPRTAGWGQTLARLSNASVVQSSLKYSQLACKRPFVALNHLLDSVARRIANLESRDTVRVGIDGIDAAGKITLADELADRLRRLGRSAVRSGIDGFHRPRQDRYARGSDCPEGYYHDSFDLDGLVEMLLRPLGPGGTGHYQTAI
jgi:pantothenate kinase